MNESAVIIHTNDAADTGRDKLMGRHVAGEGFLAGYARHAGLSQFHCSATRREDVEDFKARVNAAAGRKCDIVNIAREKLGTQPHPGCLSLPGPDVESFAWSRRFTNPRAYSICGITHTTATDRVMDGLGRLLTGPVQSWDAVVCTSHAVKATLTHVLDNWRAYLHTRLGVEIANVVQLPVIPLGVDTARFEKIGSDRAMRRKWRDKLHIGADDLCVLFVGRLSYHAKAHPLPMYMALEQAAATTNRRIHLVQAGWFANQDLEKEFRGMAASFCPHVDTAFVDGRQADTRREIWSCADVFASLSDNIQETFGLSPIEAMAAGLPVVASDWDGYRDTVRDGVDGFLVPTLMPQSGAGEDMALRFQTGLDSYDRYIGHVSQCTAVDAAATAQALTTLLNDADKRREMGAAARKRARETFDWSVVVHAHQALWAELRQRRAKDSELAPRAQGTPAHPLREDPFALFADYATRALKPADKVALAKGADLKRLDMVLSFKANSYAARYLTTRERYAVIIRSLEQFGPCAVRDLVQLFPAQHQHGVTRGIAWLAKTGLVAPQNPS